MKKYTVYTRFYPYLLLFTCCYRISPLGILPVFTGPQTPARCSGPGSEDDSGDPLLQQSASRRPQGDDGHATAAGTLGGGDGGNYGDISYIFITLLSGFSNASISITRFSSRV